MPYIKQADRDRARFQPETAGELNYAVSVLLKGYQDRKGLSYQVINDIVGALEGAKAEYYRRVVIPYENEKITENGDVY
jgi:hypothetical protein